MNKLLSDTRLVAALLALVIVCLTVLAVTHVISGEDVAKYLGGLVTGVILVWQRGTETKVVEKPAEEKKEMQIPPVLPLLGICLALLLLPGASCAGAKPVIRTVNDIAADWCVAHYSAMQGLSVDDALRTFCTGEKALKPWLDLILMGQKNGVGKSGIAHEPECEVTVVKESAPDAGRD